MSRAMKEFGSRGGWTLPGTGRQSIPSPPSSPEGKALASHELIVALGDRLYRVERPFGSWPRNTGFVTDVAVDPRGHVFVMLRHDPLVHPNDPRVIELAPDGAYLSGWGGDLIADSHMLTVDATGRVLAVDRDMHEVIICSPTGERLGGLGQRGVPLAPFNHPTDVHVSAWGEIYVSDGYAASRVHRFDAAGTLIASWGEFYQPIAIWGDDEGCAYISDMVPSLQKVGRKGERLGRCRPMLNGAHGIFGTPDGDILLAEVHASRIPRLRLQRAT